MTPGHFLASGVSIFLIDLLLAGDNALVIAMAVRCLPARERRLGIFWGAALAVILRIALTTVAARLLTFEYLELAGGLLVLWIALKVLLDASDPPDAAPAPRQLWRAVWVIVLADLTMSADNILAIAGASNGHFGLIVFGLCLSIPFVVFSSNLLAELMGRYPAVIYIGAAILCKVGGDMVLEDPFVTRTIHPTAVVRYLADILLVFLMLAAGRYLSNSRRGVIAVE
jgi:YjbE family integral membrane protein